jgi:hypothetical protein
MLEPACAGSLDACSSRSLMECEAELGCVVVTPQPCVSPSECDDGIGCNGEEQCVSGVCAAGEPPDCDDGVICTVDSCEEPGTCAHVGSCPGLQTCEETGCAGSICTLLTNDGCDAGFTCGPRGPTETDCFEDGTLGADRMCSIGDDRCGSGTWCGPSGISDFRTCRRLCGTNADCPGSLSQCLEPLVVDGVERGDVMACTELCNPATPTSGCVGGYRCALLYGGGAHTQCRPFSGRAENQACAPGADECSPGLVCIPNGTSGNCRRICDAESDCISLDDCNPLAGIFYGGTQLGACY